MLEAKELTMLKLEQLIGSLITHETITSNDDKKKKQYLALKISTENYDWDDDKDEEVAFLSWKINWFLIRKRKVETKLQKVILTMVWDDANAGNLAERWQIALS